MGFGKKKSYNYYDMKYEEYCARLEELSDDAEDCIEELDDLLDEFDEILYNVEGLKDNIEKTTEGLEDKDKKENCSGYEEDIILDMDEIPEVDEENKKFFPEGEIDLEEGSFDEWLHGEEWDAEQYQEQKCDKCEEEIMNQSDFPEDICEWDMKEESESSEDECEWDESSNEEYFRCKYKLSEKGDLEETDQPDIVKEIEEGECGCQEEEEINEKYEEYKRFCEDLMQEDEENIENECSPLEKEEIEENIENECPPLEKEEIEENIENECSPLEKEEIEENIENECPPVDKEEFKEEVKEKIKEKIEEKVEKKEYPKSPAEDKKSVPLKPDKKQKYYEQYLKIRSKKPSGSKYYQKGECKRWVEKEEKPSKKMG